MNRVTGSRASAWDSIWFDAGGVLFDNVFEDTPFITNLAEAWGVDGGRLQADYRNAQPLLETGHLTLEELWQDLRGSNPLAGNVDDAVEHYRRHLRPDHSSWGLLHWVRSLGYRLVMANNEIREWDVVRERCFPSSPLFESKLTSWSLGIAKPDARFYSECLTRTRSRPKHTLYFDDDPECVVQARALEIEAHIWAGAEDARMRVLMADTQAGERSDAG